MEFVAIIVLLLVVGLLMAVGLPKGRQRTDEDTTTRSPRPRRARGWRIPGSAARRHAQGKP